MKGNAFNLLLYLYYWRPTPHFMVPRWLVVSASIHDHLYGNQFSVVFIIVYVFLYRKHINKMK